MDSSMMMDNSDAMSDDEDILYQPMEETVYVLENCVILPAGSSTSNSAEKNSPVKPKIKLQKKLTKAELKKQQKQQQQQPGQQRDLLKECIQELDGQDFVQAAVTLSNSPNRPAVHTPRPNPPKPNPPKVIKVVPQVKEGPKIVLKSNGRNVLSKRDCELIKDCVEALADQDCVETFKLRTRDEPLSKSEWLKVADVVVKLMQQYLPENGVEDIDHRQIEQARYQLKETYKWGGYVIGKDFTYSEEIRSIKQDSCYDSMRSRNNTMRKLNSRKNQGPKPLKEKVKIPRARRIVRVVEEVPEKKISNQRRLSFRAFCDELSLLPVGHQFTAQQIETANSYWDCLEVSLKTTHPNQYHVFPATGELSVLRHIRLYLNFVRRILKREDTIIHKFQENCDMYLACLEDILKSFPPTDLYDIKSLDVKSSPYISLVKIIASQLGQGCSFIVDPDVSTHEMREESGPIYLVKSGSFYDLWVNGIVVVPHMQEIQAIFCLATSEDVFCIRQTTPTDSSEVIDFMRKFFLQIFDFTMKQPKITLLGQAFVCFSEIKKTKLGGFPKPNRFLCYDKAKQAIDNL